MDSKLHAWTTPVKIDNSIVLMGHKIIQYDYNKPILNKENEIFSWKIQLNEAETIDLHNSYVLVDTTFYSDVNLMSSTPCRFFKSANLRINNTLVETADQREIADLKLALADERDIDDDDQWFLPVDSMRGGNTIIFGEEESTDIIKSLKLKLEGYSNDNGSTFYLGFPDNQYKLKDDNPNFFKSRSLDQSDVARIDNVVKKIKLASLFGFCEKQGLFKIQYLHLDLFKDDEFQFLKYFLSTGNLPPAFEINKISLCLKTQRLQGEAYDIISRPIRHYYPIYKKISLDVPSSGVINVNLQPCSSGLEAIFIRFRNVNDNAQPWLSPCHFGNVSIRFKMVNDVYLPMEAMCTKRSDPLDAAVYKSRVLPQEIIPPQQTNRTYDPSYWYRLYKEYNKTNKIYNEKDFMKSQFYCCIDLTRFQHSEINTSIVTEMEISIEYPYSNTIDDPSADYKFFGNQYKIEADIITKRTNYCDISNKQCNVYGNIL